MVSYVDDVGVQRGCAVSVVTEEDCKGPCIPKGGLGSCCVPDTLEEMEDTAVSAADEPCLGAYTRMGGDR